MINIPSEYSWMSFLFHDTNVNSSFDACALCIAMKRYETCDCIKYNSIVSLHVDKSNMPIQRVLGANTSNYIDFE